MIINKLLKYRPVFAWYWLIVLYSSYVTVLNHNFYSEYLRRISESNNSELILKISLPVIVFLFSCLFSILFSSRFILKPYLSLSILILSLVYYARTRFGVLFDSEMIQNVVETNSQEASTYINFQSFFFFVITGVLPAVLVWFPKIVYSKGNLKSFLAKTAVFVTLFTVTAGLFLINFKALSVTYRNNKYLSKEIIPFCAIVSTTKVIYRGIKANVAPPEYQHYAKRAMLYNTEERPTIFIYVLGETARAANYKQNGYERNTTPYTDEQEKMIFFRDVISCGTSTNVSLPCMFSSKTRSEIDFDKTEFEDGLTDFIEKAGYEQFWMENDSSCKGVCKNIKNYKSFEKTLIEDNEILSSKCKSEFCYDEVLLADLDRILAAKDNESKVIFLHLIGSHGPTYFNRTPEEFKKCRLTCETSDLTKCTQEEIRNAYDNTLLYTDYVISQVVNKVSTYEASHNIGVLYVSDHGESLGENGLFLHGSPYYMAPNFQKRVPMQLWLNRNMLEARNIDRECLVQNSLIKEKYSHDNLFHSVLSILNIKTEYYKSDLDIFSSCKK